jgi:hypothetical protein
MSALRSLIGATVALSMTATPVLAQSAQKLSLSNAQPVRAQTVTTKSSKATGGLLIPLIGLSALAAGIIVIAATNDDEPDSP